MKIAVEGCCHGELDKIYETLQHLEKVNNTKVDLLLICGDFQAVRNRDDLRAMAVPPKYQKLNTFYKYYSGEKVAPVLTIFIGGNHEASNYMQELPYGGWVAENIYYMGYANVIQVGGLRIGGLSGIYKEKDYYKGHFEHPPYTEDTKRSVYHVRNIEVFRLKQLKRPLDIFLSHDWPTDIARYGDMNHLFRKKPFLRSEVMDGSLGSPPAAQLLHKLQPSYWFSAHLHVKYAASMQHPDGKITKFLSLDKCLPRRQFLQVLDFADRGLGPMGISLDPEWLCVLQSTNHLMHLARGPHYMPGPQSSERSNFEVLDEDIAKVKELFGGDLTLPKNFKTTAPTLKELENNKPNGPPVLVNPQTAVLCTMLDLTDPNAVHLGISNLHTLSQHLGPAEVGTLELSEDDNGDDDDDDDVPTDVSSSMDRSCINSSLDLSDSFSASPGRTTLSARLSNISAGFTPPTAQVDDDDEEFKAILKAQRRNSQQPGASSQRSVESPEQQNGSRSDGEPRSSGPPSPKPDSADTGTVAVAVEGPKDRTETADSGKDGKLVEGAAACGDKSSSDIDSTSQDSQEELDPSVSRGDSLQACTTDSMEVSAGSDSSTEGRWTGPRGKHPSPTPTPTSAESPSLKKLKRRNVSMYAPSATDEPPN